MDERQLIDALLAYIDTRRTQAPLRFQDLAPRRIALPPTGRRSARERLRLKADRQRPSALPGRAEAAQALGSARALRAPHPAAAPRTARERRSGVDRVSRGDVSRPAISTRKPTRR